MKQYIVSLDEQTNAIIQQAAAQAHMDIPEFFQHTALVYMVRQQARSGGEAPPPAEERRAGEKAAPRRGRAASPKPEDLVFSHFIGFFNEKLCACRQTYVWSYQISPESCVSWLDPKLREGSSAEDSLALQGLCGEKLREAAAAGDETLCFEAVRLAMDWGKAYFNHRYGVLKGNEEIVSQLHQSGELLPVIRRSAQAIRDGRFSDLEYFSTGWSVVWHVLDPERIPIMGTREIYAYNRVLAEFQAQSGEEKLPAALRLGQLVYKKNRRYVPGVPYVYTLKGKLRMLERFSRIMDAVKAMGDLCTLAEIDEKLFMLGE